MAVVFDAEPLIAYALDEEGSESVENHLMKVRQGEEEGYVTEVNLAELRYVSLREASKSVTDDNIRLLLEMGIETIGTDEIWKLASGYKERHSVALGDAFALGCAEFVDASLVAGADDDFDDITKVEIERFRENAV